MKMNFNKYRSKPLSWWLQTPTYAKRIIYEKMGGRGALARRMSLSYSQCAEDLIVRKILRRMGIKLPNYLDIGAYDATHLSNTMLFYKMGASGVCIEPNVIRAQNFARQRPKDRVLNVGVGSENAIATPFYIMSDPALSGFDMEGCLHIEERGIAHIVQTTQVNLVNINVILKDHFTDGLDFLSLDIEGWDEIILRSINFDLFLPKVICVETIDFLSQERRNFASDFLPLMGYSTHSSTPINTIFFHPKYIK